MLGLGLHDVGLRSTLPSLLSLFSSLSIHTACLFNKFLLPAINATPMLMFSFLLFLQLFLSLHLWFPLLQTKLSFQLARGPSLLKEFSLFTNNFIFRLSEIRPYSPSSFPSIFHHHLCNCICCRFWDLQ